jgi:hypothetical protein
MRTAGDSGADSSGISSCCTSHTNENNSKGNIGDSLETGRQNDPNVPTHRAQFPFVPRHSDELRLEMGNGGRPCWAHPKPSWDHERPRWAHQMPNWAHLRLGWAHHGLFRLIRGLVKRILRPRMPHPKLSKAHLRPSWAHPRPIWAYLRRSWAHLRPCLIDSRPSWAFPKPSRVFLG